MHRGFPYRKATQALNYFAKREGGQINIMKAIKLIWLADRLHLRQFGRPIVNDVYFAMEYGTVPSNTTNIAKDDLWLTGPEKEYKDTYVEKVNKYLISTKQDCDLLVFSKTDLSCLSEVYETFGDLNKWDLSALSHKYPEWKRYESDLKQGTYSRVEMDYLDFFKNPEEGNAEIFDQSEEVLELSKSFMHSC